MSPRLACGALLACASVAGAAQPQAEAGRSRETPAAREQARLCERLDLAQGAEACRAALALGIGPSRRGPVRQLLARHLVALEQWEQLAELYREEVRLDPTDAAAWQRLGTTLLYALDRRSQAIAALHEAARLAPDDAQARAELGLALAADGRLRDAVLALREALRLDASALEARPAGRAVLEAVEQGTAWP